MVAKEILLDTDDEGNIVAFYAGDKALKGVGVTASDAIDDLRAKEQNEGE